MTYEEKKEWLLRYKRAEKKRLCLVDELKEAQADSGRTTQEISPTPSGGGDGQALPRAVERIDAAQSALDDQAHLCDVLRCELIQKLLALKEPNDYEIMSRRYSRLQEWEQIADEMCLGLRQIYRHHRRAIDELNL